MKQITRNRKIIILVIMMVLMFSHLMSITSLASHNIEKADLYSKGECGALLKKGGTTVRVTYVVYQNKGKEYPAYCLDKFKPGVGEEGDYDVTPDQVITNTYVWRVIINGFPYKTPNELGCANEKEAFTATKMAVYCVLYDYTIDTFTAIGEAGQRTLNALNQILAAARASTETKLSSMLTITEKTKDWIWEAAEKKYISKTFEIQATSNMENYQIQLQNQGIEGALVTDSNNQPKTEFLPKETFKILLPITELGKGGEINILASSAVETKPIFLGMSPDPNRQDYAITGSTFEDGIGTKTILYGKNETKLTILKKDADNQKQLANAHFDLLDDTKNVCKTDLVSNDKGEIILEDILPGKYYLKETKAPEGYLLYQDLISLEIGFNEELSIIVHDGKEEKPKVETSKKIKEVKQQVKKLPKAGM